jgi:cytochrome c oxidase subunit 2
MNEAAALSALVPAGPQAAHIHTLWLVMLAVCSLVFAGVLGALAIALRRGRRGDGTNEPDTSMAGQDEPAIRRTVTFGVAASAALLIGLLAVTIATARALAQLPLRDALHIRLTGHQWWWEATYDDPQPANVFTTANELHVPVGRPVVLTLEADDVIHSFWVPNLHGKKDLIPGRTATVAFRADVAGTYRGQCAEFCGYQHANMALFVIAEPPERYEQWAAAARTSAPQPTESLAQRGQQVFLQSTCAMCHTIVGTPANGRRAPDLTHVASRLRIGAGMLPNDPVTLSAWISDPQRIKPGVNMPAHALPGADLQALVAYLGTLK